MKRRKAAIQVFTVASKNEQPNAIRGSKQIVIRNGIRSSCGINTATPDNCLPSWHALLAFVRRDVEKKKKEKAGRDKE